MNWSYQSLPDQDGRTFLITGANTGIGFETARLLAAKRADVILACRNPDKAVDAKQRIVDQHPIASVSVMRCDLSSMASVKELVDAVLKQGKLDALVNNAGLLLSDLSRTEEGFEQHFGTNVLSHFVLTGLLLPLLEKSALGRIVSLTSVGHWVGKIDMRNLNAEKRFSWFSAYAQSKLANLMFAYELQRRLVRHNKKSISVAAHPGVTRTDLARDSSTSRLIMGLFSQNTAQGALPSLMAATDPTLKGGELVGPRGRMNFKGEPTVHLSSKASYDESVAAALWEEMQQLTEFSYP